MCRSRTTKCTHPEGSCSPIPSREAFESYPLPQRPRWVETEHSSLSFHLAEIFPKPCLTTSQWLANNEEMHSSAQHNGHNNQRKLLFEMLLINQQPGKYTWFMCEHQNWALQINLSSFSVDWKTKNKKTRNHFEIWMTLHHIAFTQRPPFA